METKVIIEQGGEQFVILKTELALLVSQPINQNGKICITIDVEDEVRFIPKEIDWEQRRYEIARDIYANDSTNSITAAGAVSCADELIKALKGETK